MAAAGAICQWKLGEDGFHGWGAMFRGERDGLQLMHGFKWHWMAWKTGIGSTDPRARASTVGSSCPPSVVCFATDKIVLAFLVTHDETNLNDEFFFNWWLVTKLKPLRWGMVLKRLQSGSWWSCSDSQELLVLDTFGRKPACLQAEDFSRRKFRRIPNVNMSGSSGCRWNASVPVSSM